MPLVVDSSSPAAHTSTAQTNTCASFTPPADTLLLALWAGNTGGSDPPAPSISSSPSQSWSRDAWDHFLSGSPGMNGQAAFFEAVAAGSPGATTVTVTNGQTVSQFSSTLSVLVMTGADPGNPVGTAVGGRQQSGSSLSASYTASITGGQGFFVVCDWQALSTSTWAAATGCTILQKGTLAGEISYGVVQRTTADGVNGVTTTLGITGLVTGGDYHWCVAEVISIEAAEAVRQLAATSQQSDPGGDFSGVSQLL